MTRWTPPWAGRALHVYDFDGTLCSDSLCSDTPEFSMTRLYRALTISILFFAAPAFAEEMPCRAVGTGPLATVSCRRDAFDDLMDRMIADEAELKRQDLRLKEAGRVNVDLRMALSACIGHGVAKARSYPALPILLTALGGAVIGSSIAGQWPSGGRTVGVVVGSAVVSTGLIVALF